MQWLAYDTALRARALQRVLELQAVHANELPWAAISEGFMYSGVQHYLASKAEGIFKPRDHPAPLSVKTTIPRPGRVARYADSLDQTGGMLRYAYKAVRGGADNAANRAMRVAMTHRLPLIYFWGLAPGVYSAVAPIYVVHDDPSASEFLLAPGAATAVEEVATHVHELLRGPPEKHYLARVVLQRLHQRAFRHNVIAAYGHRCAMCSIRFDEFLEAAHIIPDRDPLGSPDVRNGLALCGLHHSAFDRFLVDVSDDYRVVVSPELRRRKDGPLFQQAFIDRHLQALNLPVQRDLVPDAANLQHRRGLLPPSVWAEVANQPDAGHSG